MYILWKRVKDVKLYQRLRNSDQLRETNCDLNTLSKTSRCVQIKSCLRSVLLLRTNTQRKFAKPRLTSLLQITISLSQGLGTGCAYNALSESTTLLLHIDTFRPNRKVQIALQNLYRMLHFFDIRVLAMHSLPLKAQKWETRP